MSKKSPAQLAVFALVLTAILWSSGGLLIKSVGWNSFGIAGGRSLIALLVFVPFFKQIRFRMSFPMIMGAISYSLTTILFATANKMTTAANAILLQYTAPIYVIFLAALLLKERITKVDVAAVFGVFAGLVLFLFEGLNGGHLWGDALALLSGFTFAGVAVFMRMQKDVNPMTSVVLGNIINAVICIPIGFAVSTPTGGMGYLILLGLFQLGLSYALYSYAVKHVKALQIILLTTLEPLLNPVWVFLVRGEKPGWFAVAGGILVIAVVLWHTWRKQKESKRESAEEILIPEGEHAH